MYNRSLHFHFIGIGGSGMSGIAEVLLRRGYRVSGTDLRLSDTCRRLMSLGAQVSEGHDASFLAEDASLVVYSSAVPATNPEVIEAKNRDIPVIKRAEVLAELMRLKYGIAVGGSHGKTTTTSMLGWILQEAELDPTVVVGGQVRAFGSGGRAGDGEFLVAEADESDRSFLLYRPAIAVVTNIDTEHLNAYRDEEDLYQSFESFIDSIPFYGLAVLCADDRRLLDFSKSFGKRKLLYGFTDQAELQGKVLSVNEKGVTFKVASNGKHVLQTTLPMIGRHFAQNAIAAIGVSMEFGIPAEVIASALSTYPGVERRLELLGEIGGVTIYNDYGHHPTEILATISALDECYRTQGRKLRVVFEPHRYSRTEDCFDDFCSSFRQCDELIVTDIYAAGEEPIVGISGESLASKIDCPRVEHIASVEDAICEVHKRVEHEQAEPGDVILLLGAGSIGRQRDLVMSLFGPQQANVGT